ncbi:histidine kinase [Bacillus pakistanensis]|uniref:histidine kinase n=1 Tax=Rossellomorea pakistanensis TaxID=992288 RepID=A0ABS2NHC4_9BACI|nr:HAMP domain-containing sensor histidine kinase [Bacillus pakistanensis]MBM7587263.1 histidine kinase [Bacillus pakistanensis]
MSIKKRLILSNIAMIIIPILFFFFIEMMISYVLFYLLDGDIEGNSKKLFMTLRFIGLLLVLTVTNGLLTYFVSKSIITPVQKLRKAAKEISNGNLDFKIESAKKDELGELAETFESMRLKLKEAKELQKRYENNQKELIASISHDLKTPMTSIKGYVKGVMDGIADTPEKMNRYMETIYTKADDMDHLINELFLYSKLDIQGVPFNFEEMDLNAYFVDLLEEVRYNLEQDGGTVTYQVNPSDSYIVMADREKLKRVITNIIQNSLKYMDKPKKEIHVRLESESDQIMVEVKDNGTGMSQDAIPHIFERFYRIDASRNSSTGGSGLGLAIVKRIIIEHGGSIWVESELGKGTSIFFTLKKP